MSAIQFAPIICKPHSLGILRLSPVCISAQADSAARVVRLAQVAYKRLQIHGVLASKSAGPAM